MNPSSFLYIPAPPPPPPPPPEQCTRVKTNQWGEQSLLQEPLEDIPGSGAWSGPGGGAGTHQRYFYEVVPEFTNVSQQYVVMKDVTGTFLADEQLTGVPA